MNIDSNINENETKTNDDSIDIDINIDAGKEASNKDNFKLSSGFWIKPSDFKYITNKIDYGSPVIMTYFVICFIVLFIDAFCVDDYTLSRKYLMLPGTGVPFPYPGWQLITHIIAHRDISHFVGNMSLILLVGPAVERKYGSFETLTMILTDAVVTGIFNGIFLRTGLMGASGVAYLMVCLYAMASIKQGKIPLPSLFVMMIYLGVEIINALQSPSDDIAQFGHLIGGILGIMFGIYCGRNNLIGNEVEHLTLKSLKKEREEYKEYLNKIKKLRGKKKK